MLKSRGSALRVREKDGKFELTLKEPAGEGLLETTQILNKKGKRDDVNRGNAP